MREGNACDLRGRHLVRGRCLLEGGWLFKEIRYLNPYQSQWYQIFLCADKMFVITFVEHQTWACKISSVSISLKDHFIQAAE